MTGLTIGPLMFAGDRLAVALALATFLISTSVLSVRIDQALWRWSNQAFLAGLVAARLGHVARYSENFAAEPTRIFAVWQGGFSLLWGFAAVAVVTALHVKTVRFALSAALALGLSLFVWNLADQLVNTASAQTVPRQVFEQLDGEPTALPSGGGRPAVINLWATWCPPCRQELPVFAETAAKRDDVDFYFVNQGESADTIRNFLASQGLQLEHILLDRNSEAPRDLETPGLPATVFVRADGSIMTIYLGEMSPEALSERLTRLTSKKSRQKS